MTRIMYILNHSVFFYGRLHFSKDNCNRTEHLTCCITCELSVLHQQMVSPSPWICWVLRPTECSESDPISDNRWVSFHLSYWNTCSGRPSATILHEEVKPHGKTTFRCSELLGEAASWGFQPQPLGYSPLFSLRGQLCGAQLVHPFCVLFKFLTHRIYVNI
jgi:hypothetical protein